MQNFLNELITIYSGFHYSSFFYFIAFLSVSKNGLIWFLKNFEKEHSSGWKCGIFIFLVSTKKQKTSGQFRRNRSNVGLQSSRLDQKDPQDRRGYFCKIWA